jgi:transposase
MRNNKVYFRYRIIKPIIENKKSIEDIIKVSFISRASIYRWLKRYKEEGVDGLSHKTHNAYNKTSDVIRDLVYSLRKEKLFRSSGDIAKEINNKYRDLLVTFENKQEITRQTVWRILKEKGFNNYFLRRAIK